MGLTRGISIAHSLSDGDQSDLPEFCAKEGVTTLVIDIADLYVGVSR